MFLWLVLVALLTVDKGRNFREWLERDLSTPSFVFSCLCPLLSASTDLCLSLSVSDLKSNSIKNNYGFSPVMFLLFLDGLQYLLDLLNAFISNKNRLMQIQYLTT